MHVSEFDVIAPIYSSGELRCSRNKNPCLEELEMLNSLLEDE